MYWAGPSGRGWPSTSCAAASSQHCCAAHPRDRAAGASPAPPAPRRRPPRRRARPALAPPPRVPRAPSQAAPPLPLALQPPPQPPLRLAAPRASARRGGRAGQGARPRPTSTPRDRRSRRCLSPPRCTTTCPTNRPRGCVRPPPALTPSSDRAPAARPSRPRTRCPCCPWKRPRAWSTPWRFSEIFRSVLAFLTLFGARSMHVEVKPGSTNLTYNRLHGRRR